MSPSSSSNSKAAPNLAKQSKSQPSLLNAPSTLGAAAALRTAPAAMQPPAPTIDDQSIYDALNTLYTLEGKDSTADSATALKNAENTLDQYYRDCRSSPNISPPGWENHIEMYGTSLIRRI